MAALCDDILFEVLRYVDDGATLAMASCANSSLRCTSRDEVLWENLCSKRWPSSGEPAARELIASLGGFRRLYADCSRLIAVQRPFPKQQQQQQERDFSNFYCEVPELGGPSGPSSSNFTSMVDVFFKEQLLFSKFIDGIPGTDDFAGWFLGCPFRVDLVHNTDVTEGAQLGALEDDLSLKHSRVWKEIWENTKLSWIVVNKETKQVANLSSWRPLAGQRHWPTDRDFVLRFGSIVSQSLPEPAECSIILKCRVTRNLLQITEISMQLKEALTDEHLNGRLGLLALERAVASSKTRDEESVLLAHKECLRLQSDLKLQELKHEWHLDVYAFIAVSAMAAIFLVAFFRF